MLRDPDFADRGTTGKDLVDFLDGWRCYASELGELEGQRETERTAGATPQTLTTTGERPPFRAPRVP